ncbi:MAG TPA: hypothetical protein VKS79_17930 [Gemmataceae bacterium]|nr:hypothetical protein [Gemmataceae bacterium]
MASDRAPDLAEFHNLSRRHCWIDDDGCSAWLYLTEPAADSATSAPIAADAFVFNHGNPIDPERVQEYRGTQPPLCVGFASTEAICSAPGKFSWSLLWSDDGESVAVLRDDAPLAFILNGEKRGYSKAIEKVGPYGNPWSKELFERTFT